MIPTISLKSIFKKDIKTICLYLGGFYAFFGTGSLLMLLFQTSMPSNIESQLSNDFVNMQTILFEVWIVYMPLMILLGLCYVIFGLLYPSIKANRFNINLALSILSLIWVIAYALSNLKYMDVIVASMADDFEFFKYIAYAFGGFGFIATFALFTVPQYIISKRIKKQTVQNE